MTSSTRATWPGQVRDAAAGQRGWPTGHSGSRRVRLLAAVVLSGPGCLRGGGAAWPGPAATGAEAGAQALRGGRRSTRTGAQDRPFAELHPAGTATRGGTRAAGPSAERGTGTQPTPKKGGPAQTVKGLQSGGDLTPAYAALRAQATGQLPAV